MRALFRSVVMISLLSASTMARSSDATTPLSGTKFDDIMIIMMGVDGSEPAFTYGGAKLQVVRLSSDSITDPGNPKILIKFTEPKRCIFAAEPSGVGVLTLDANKGLEWKYGQPAASPFGGKWMVFTARSTAPDLTFRSANGQVARLDMDRPVQLYGDIERFRSAMLRLKERCAS